MKILGSLLTSWLVCVNAQIIFPDEYELMKQSRVGQSQTQSPFPTLPTTSTDIRLTPHDANDGNKGRPSFGISGLNPGTITEAALGTIPQVAAGVNFSSVSGVVDAETLYWNNRVNSLLTRGVTKFTLDIDRAIHRTQNGGVLAERPNVIFSPLSVVGTLAMVLLGSAGVTFEQVAKILGLETGVDISAHSEIVHHMFGLLLDSIHAGSTPTGPQVQMANGIFVQDGYPIRPEFRSISQQIYKNEVINLDFQGHPSEATRTVNDWVEARTRGKISSILSQQIDSNTKLIIASALYFSGEWHQHFFTRSTKKKPFAVTPSHSVVVDMMYSAGEFPFYEDKQLGVKIIGLPYKGYDQVASTENSKMFEATMYVLLPTSKSADALGVLENRLSTDVLDGLTRQMVNQSCVLGLPRMKLSSTLNLNRALESMGLTSLFNPDESNLGLLSPGHNNGRTNGGTLFSTRIGGEGESINGGNVGSGVPPARKNHFRYEDKNGGYSVEQWNSGVIIEKIRRSIRRRRSEARQQHREFVTASTSQRDTESYRTANSSTSNEHEPKVVGIGENKYRYEDASSRQKRQNRPIDNDFVRFVQTHQNFPKYGLDTLRNSPNLANPGLFASDVLHKVEMDITETGTVGAAATTILLQRSGDAKRLLANRPFIFFIRHEASKLILFWGTVNKPTPNY